MIGGGSLASRPTSTVQYFSLADEPHGDRLNAARRKPPLHFFPKERRDLITHEPVQDPARLLGLVFVGVESTGLTDGVLNAFLRDLLDQHPLQLAFWFLQLGRDVPSDRFPFAVRVGREVDHLGRSRRVGDFLQDLFLAWDRDVLRLEVVFDVDAQGAVGEVFDVALGGENLIVLA
jgi:hypothetical protein